MQTAVAVEVASEIRSGFARVAPGDVRAAMPSLIALVAEVTRKYGAALSTHAVRDYMAARTAAGVRGGFRPTPADPAPLPQVSAMTGWATRDLRVIEPRTAPTAPLPPPSEEVIQAAERDLVAGAEKLTLNAARNTVAQNVERDRQAVGWYFATDADPCYWCALIASRSIVFQHDSFEISNKQFVGKGRAKVHNNCRCNLAPAFSRSMTLPDINQRALEVYKARGEGDALNAFRKAWEARSR